MLLHSVACKNARKSFDVILQYINQAIRARIGRRLRAIHCFFCGCFLRIDPAKSGNAMSTPLMRVKAEKAPNPEADPILFFLKKYQELKVTKRNNPSVYSTVVNKNTYGDKPKIKAEKNALLLDI